MAITRDLSLATLSANRQKLDDISSGFDGANTDFTLTVSSTEITPSSPNHLIISLNGVIQEPTTSYNVTGSTLSFTTAPASTATFFGVHTETTTAGNPGTPPDGSVGTAQLSTANVAFDSTTLFIDSTNNRVGVGTITPATALDVTGTITSDGLTVGDGHTIGDDGFDNLVIESSSGENIRLVSNHATVPLDITSDVGLLVQTVFGTDRLFVDNSTGDISFYEDTGASQKFFWDASAESLGIGTSSPADPLHIYNPTPFIRLTDSSLDTRLARIGGENGNITIDIDPNAAAAASYFSIDIDNDEKLRVDDSGNLLVGTTDNTVYNNSGSGTGINLQNFGNIAVARDGNDCMVLNRLNSDGPIALFSKDGTSVGSISASVEDLVIGTGDVGIKFNNGLSTIYPYHSNGTSGVQDNLVDLGLSSARWKDLYLSGGVYLGGTGSANLLDDYEEGTYLPILYGGSTGTGTPLPLRSVYDEAAYTKIGRQVTITGKLETLGSHSASGPLRLTLPFAVANPNDQAGNAVGPILMYRTGQSAYTNPVLLAPQNASYLTFYENTTGGDIQSIDAQNMDSAIEFFMTITYFTTS